MAGSLQGFCGQLYAAVGVFGNAGGSENCDNNPHCGGFLFPQVQNQRLPRKGFGVHQETMGNKGANTNLPPANKGMAMAHQQSVNNQEAFQIIYDNPDNQRTWWKPTGLTSEIESPFLLAIPNALVELL